MRHLISFIHSPTARIVARVLCVALLIFGASEIAHAADDADITNIGSDLWTTAKPMMEKLKWVALSGVGMVSAYRAHKSHNYGHLLWIPGIYLIWDKVMGLAASSVVA